MEKEKTLKELSDDELSKITGSKNSNIVDIIKKMYDLVRDYPEVVEIIDSYEKNDFSKTIALLQQLFVNHPELSYLMEE